MDIEWGKDGGDGKLYILQARPETVKAQAEGKAEQRFKLKGDKSRAPCWPKAARSARRSAPARCAWSAASSEMDAVQPGDVLVTDMTDPNWEPVMKRASAIVTNRGGRTCHAAIIARELGIPAVVGCGDATEIAQGRRAGHRVLRRGRHRLHLRRPARDRDHRGPARRTARRAAIKIMMNVGNPQLAFDFCQMPNARRRPGAARVHHQQQHRHPPEGDPRLSERRCRPEEGGRERWPAATPARAPSTSTSWPKASPPSPPRSGRSR